MSIRIDKITRGRFGNKILQYNSLIQLGKKHNVSCSMVQNNEMTYFLKVLYNYQIVHDYYIKNDINPKNLLKNTNVEDVCFTKVLTKYSNEYSNNNFLTNTALNRDMSRFEIYSTIINNKVNNIMFTNQEIKRLKKLFLIDIICF